MTLLQLRSAAARKGARTRKRLVELRQFELASRETRLAGPNSPTLNAEPVAVGEPARARTKSTASLS